MPAVVHWPMRAVPPPRQSIMVPGVTPAIERGIREISAADRHFDMLAFVEGAKGAYKMVLEAFWRGDREALAQLCDGDVLAGSFTAEIDAREAAGEHA
jgi:predicted lipid-binding transport protein (Tim44 family)